MTGIVTVEEDRALGWMLLERLEGGSDIYKAVVRKHMEDGYECFKISRHVTVCTKNYSTRRITYSEV